MPDSQVDPRFLSTMLEFDDIHRHQWSNRDLQDMLMHQLAAPLHLGLGPLGDEVAKALRALPEPRNPRMTLDELLQHERPPLELLMLVKRFSKLCRRSAENPLPSEIVMFLYYTSITVALLRLNEPITELSDVSVIRGVNWLSVQPWMPEHMQVLLREGLKHLRSRNTDKT
jgi:hypothetical protein